MSVLNKFHQVVRSVFGMPGSGGDSSDFDDDFPDDLAGLASVLSITIEPSPRFVDSLGALLDSTYTTASGSRGPVRPGVFRWRKVGMRVLYAAIAFAILGALAIFVEI
jgi:hypothetical protein